MNGIFLMGHKFKIIGLIIALIAFAAIIIEKVNGFIVIRQFNAAQHNAIFEWILLLGLVMMIYSEEKHDDERVQAIRLKSFQVAFVVLVGVIMNIGTLAVLFPEKVLLIHPQTLLMICTMVMVLYLLVFHAGLYFKANAD